MHPLDSLTYQCIDSRTGRVVRSMPGTKRNALRRWADKQDSIYGAVRYVVRPVLPAR